MNLEHRQRCFYHAAQISANLSYKNYGYSEYGQQLCKEWRLLEWNLYGAQELTFRKVLVSAIKRFLIIAFK